MRTAWVDEAALDGFDALPAGPELAAALEATDLASLAGEDAAAWMRAGFRARNHADWLLLVAIREACTARAGVSTRVPLDEFAPRIAAASLGWTATMAAARLDAATGILERMPDLAEAMRDGRMELAKATSFVTGLDGLTDEQARDVVTTLLPEAPGLGLSELRARILDAAYCVDPAWGAARLAAATARARVTAETAPSGAVDLCGRDLDPNLAQHAKMRPLALAIRARLRAGGHRFALGFIEARVFVRLMDGTHAGATDDTTIIDALTTELAIDTTPSSGTHDGDEPDDRPGPERGAEPAPNDGDSDSGPGSPDDGPGSPDDGPGEDGTGGASPGPDGPRGPRPTPNGNAGPAPGDPPADHPTSTPDGPDGDTQHPAAPTPDAAAAEPAAAPADASPGGPPSCVPFTPGIGVRLTLSTLLGLDDQPGTLPGLGPVPADTARAAAHFRGAAAWKVLVHDEAGHLRHLLTLRGPPDCARDPRFGRQTVQITAPVALPDALDPDTPRDAAALTGAHPVLHGAATTTWLATLRDALARSIAADPDEHPATTTRERHRRFPSARLAEFVRARDQTCVAPACTRPAEACDLDHTLDWLHHGTTEARDLEALCRHDHRAKHEGGWNYQQPAPGQFVITDPTGTRHHVESRVIHPRPHPLTPCHAITPDPTLRVDREDWAPRRTRDGRITPEARTTTEHLARRAHEEEAPSRYDHDPDF